MLSTQPSPGSRQTFLIIIIALIIKCLFIGSNDLLAEEAYYWNYAAHLDVGYLDHPPMVAALIKIATELFGPYEFAVRLPSIACWFVTAWFSMRLTHQIKPGSAGYVLLLLSVLPFFFIHSIVITPDIPLMTCWSAALYYLHNALVQSQSKAWYWAGMWLGFGMLSKYSIALLGPATLLYLLLAPEARSWFYRKEPYLCLLIASVLFTPVIYWNATHEWASFVFQSTRRWQATRFCSVHQLMGLLCVFLTPLGVLGLLALFRKKSRKHHQINEQSALFLLIFAITPLMVFFAFSLTHAIKFNWIGPSLLAVVPWLAILMKKARTNIQTLCFITAFFLVSLYAALLGCITTGYPISLNRAWFSKYIAWDDFSRQVHAMAHTLQQQTDIKPIIIPMDLYNIGSELSFYQAKFINQGLIQDTYSIVGRDRFGHDSLMYQYWSKNTELTGKPLMLISEKASDFSTPEVTMRARAKSPIQAFWATSQGSHQPIRQYYVQVVQMK